MRVFAYLRVSGKAQIDGDGFERQQQSIAAYCERKGYVIARVFSERGVSGTSDLAERPAFTEMLELCGGAVTAIVVERSDRLARDLIVNEMLVLEATKRGVKIFEAQSDLDLTCADDPTRVLIRQILAVLAQWDKSVLVRRLRVARDRLSLERGKRIEGGKPWEERSPRNMAHAKEIFEMHAIQRLTFREIAQEFNRRRVPTPNGKGFWYMETVRNIHDRFSRSVPAPVQKCERVRNEINPVFSDVLGHVMPEPKV